MAVLQIITGQNHPVLRGKNEKISSFGKGLQRLISDMVETAEHAGGVGLAAPQVAVSKRLVVTRIGKHFIPIINPKIIWESDRRTVMEEGCLSLPEIWIHISRPSEIIIRYFDEKGGEQERKFNGTEARAIQHEIDHLNGVLIVDYPFSGSLRHDPRGG